jgi:hypothetical protein
MNEVDALQNEIEILYKELELAQAENDGDWIQEIKKALRLTEKDLKAALADQNK